ncbi:hypothetical protein VPH35_126995 [Triticum aestivum]
MKLFVETFIGTMISINVDPSDTINVVKAKIQDRQRLTFGEDELEDKHTIRIFVKMLTGKTTVLVVENLDTVDCVKGKIRDVWGVPVGLQRILYRGKQLQDLRTMDDYAVKDDDTFELVLRLLSWIRCPTAQGSVPSQEQDSDTCSPTVIISAISPEIKHRESKIQAPVDAANLKRRSRSKKSDGFKVNLQSEGRIQKPKMKKRSTSSAI